MLFACLPSISLHLQYQYPYIYLTFGRIYSQGTYPDWIGGEKEALEGFSWRGGSERDTTGILMWSKPYVKVLPSGEEVCSFDFFTVHEPFITISLFG